jgi:hypothetical protein
LAEGDNVNRNNPDLRYWVGFYYQNKFGQSDKVTTLRCLVQLSCIPDKDRNPEDLLNPNRSVNLEKFEEFCAKNPQLVRRLKETRIVVDGNEERARPLAYSPNEVITFLRNNRKLPSRYKGGTHELADRLAQFPVFPEMSGEPGEAEEISWRDHVGDEKSDAFLAARAWYAHSLNAVPPPISIPGAKIENPDPYRYRFPKRPALIIFRQGPPRAQTYHAERLTKEGWFDKDPWSIDDLNPEQQGGSELIWLPRYKDETKKELLPVSAKFTTPINAQDAWKTAADRWRQHGERTGLYMDSAKLKNYLDKAETYVRLRPGLTLGMPTPPMTADEAADPEKAEAHMAHSVMFNLVIDRQMTNYESFDLEAQGMSTDDAIQAKKLLAKAEKYRLELREKQAIPLYEQGFDLWKKALARQDCRARRSTDPSAVNQSCRDFRDLTTYQEEMYDLNARYVKLQEDINRESRREYRRWLNDIVMTVGGLNAGSPFQWATSLTTLSQDMDKSKQPISSVLKVIAPLRLPGPLDGNAPDGTPWINEDIQQRIRDKYNLVKRPTGPVEIPQPKAVPDLPKPPTQ